MWDPRTLPPRGAVVFGVALLLTSTPVAAEAAAEQAVAEQPTGLRTVSVKVPALSVSDLRLEPPPASDSESSALLRFNLENYGITQLGDIILRIGIYTKPSEGELSRALVRPFALRTDATLEPGYVIEYEMRLRNVSVNCDCTPEVEVLSARAPQ